MVGDGEKPWHTGSSDYKTPVYSRSGIRPAMGDAASGQGYANFWDPEPDEGYYHHIGGASGSAQGPTQLGFTPRGSVAKALGGGASSGSAPGSMPDRAPPRYSPQNKQPRRRSRGARNRSESQRDKNAVRWDAQVLEYDKVGLEPESE